jgi:hypothetical protein
MKYEKVTEKGINGKVKERQKEKWLVPLRHIWKVSLSNFCREVRYPEFFRCLLRFLQANAELEHKIRSQSLPSISFTIHYALSYHNH